LLFFLTWRVAIFLFVSCKCGESGKQCARDSREQRVGGRGVPHY
jgi:hypothetical protein